MARRDETPRDLLFGLLALHTGLIDQDQLLAAFGAWSRNKGKTLAEILVERGSIDAESRSLLSAMAEKQLKLHGGDTEKSLAAVAAGPSTREKLAALGDAELTASVGFVGSHTPSQDATATMSVGTSTSDGQRFRVLRPHAQGGLGAVFVALDGELNREVALKQILDQHADDPNSRTRFLLEAEITGGLEHPGIVPVYGLGHYGNGRPYYAMRFIRGDSLKDAVAAFHGDPTLKSDPGKRSLALRKLMRRFVDVCNAIDYAHGRGILHRDLKPGNVIVGKHGETLVVDWGLAKAMGHAEAVSQTDERTLMPSSSSGSAETLPGSAIGTPAYMSPEQACGDLEKLGPRSDVYSLGATLYCLLTGKAPFEGTDLGTVLREVQKGSFPPPRQVDPSIDRALEAVCLKAMATSPNDRHATARALADDVERWAADEPTSAWREPASVRARRWMRRNRSAVTAISAAVLVALVGLAVVLTVQSRANVRLEAKNKELDKANRLKDEANAGLVEANGRVQARFELAREAIRSFQDGVNEDDMLKGQELKGLRDKLLRSAAGFYEKLEKLLQGQTDRASRAILAQSYFELGELIGKIGIQSEALAVQRKALAIRRELAALPDADAGARLELARSLIAVGELARATSDGAGALSALEEARALVEPLASGPGATDAARDVLGNCHHILGHVLESMGRRAESLKSYGRALEIRDRLAEENPTVSRFGSQLASTHNNIALLWVLNGQYAEAMESFSRALEIRARLVEENPTNTAFRESLALLHTNIGMTQSRMGQSAESMESSLRAMAMQVRLVEENPAVTRFRNSLAITYNNIGWQQSLQGQTAEALESCNRALAIQARLVEENPAVTEYRSRLSLTHSNIGEQYSRNGRTAEALESFGRALEIRAKLVEDDPTNTWVRGRLAESHTDIGLLQANTGRTAEGLESLRQALSIRSRLARENPGRGEFQEKLAISHHEIGHCLLLAEDVTGAISEYREAIATLENLPMTADRLYMLASFQSSLVAAATRPESGIAAGEAEARAIKAVSTLKRAIGAGYRNLRQMWRDTDLDPLRKRPDFQLLMMDLAFPARPFAR
jgi:eukaryotic-like serine/threonine-protein kinase